jgi:two-component system, LytTR family, sensor kinase
MQGETKQFKQLVSWRAALMTIIGFWIFHAAIVSLRAAVMDFPNQDELSTRRLFVTVMGIFLNILLYLFLRTFERRPLSWRAIAAFLASIPCSIGFALVNFYAFNIYDPASLFDNEALEQIIKDGVTASGMTPVQEIAQVAITWYFFIVAWASLYLAIGVASEVRAAERIASRYAQAAQDAELRSLRYQVNPHFLFNTLNSLSSLVITGRNAQAESMIQNLSSFYRNSLTSDMMEDVTLAEEVELQQQYLQIEMVRFPKRLLINIDIDPALHDIKVPALILQPLVENAIKYGVSRTTRPVHLTIRAKADNGPENRHAIITIEDDGEEGGHEAVSSSGIGLPNVRDRLDARYKGKAHLDTQSKPTGGFIATLTIPMEQSS